MTVEQYKKWGGEIMAQKDLIISTQQYQRLCNIFIQDVWLDVTQPAFVSAVREKAVIMFELQGHFVK